MIVVQVTICDDDGKVLEQTVKKSDSTYAWEIARLFEELGARFAHQIDPDYIG